MELGLRTRALNLFPEKVQVTISSHYLTTRIGKGETEVVPNPCVYDYRRVISNPSYAGEILAGNRLLSAS